VSEFRGKILVIRGGAIGDFILTVPALAALRRHFPQARLEVLGYPHIIQLAVAAGLADQAQSIEARALAGFFARGGKLAEELADYFSEFDLILSYLYDPDEIFEINVRRCSPAQFITGPHRADEKAKLHAARAYLKPLERLAIFDPDPVPRLSFTAPLSKLSFQPSAPKVLALHPGSGSPLKNWPEERWSELMGHLVNATNLQLLLVGGEAEGERLQRLVAATPSPRVRLAHNRPLPELARQFEACAGFIGHDSGISHLAAAVGLPGLVLWGDTDVEVWRPPSQKIVLLHHPAGLTHLPLTAVVARLAAILNSQP